MIGARSDLNLCLFQEVFLHSSETVLATKSRCRLCFDRLPESESSSDSEALVKSSSESSEIEKDKRDDLRSRFATRRRTYTINSLASSTAQDCITSTAFLKFICTSFSEKCLLASRRLLRHRLTERIRIEGNVPSFFLSDLGVILEANRIAAYAFLQQSNVTEPESGRSRSDPVRKASPPSNLIARTL